MAAVRRLAQAPLPLEGALQLFRRFDEAGVRYCHFKSNVNLLLGLAGETDLDILVDRRQARAVELALLASDFRRFCPTFAAGYPAVEDYLGFDAGKGRLIHVHLHYRLVLGEKHLKNYQLDLAETLLTSRIADPATGVYKSDPHYELYLLLIRSALKIRWRDYAMELFGRRFFGGHLHRELLWLLDQTEASKVEAIARRELGPGGAALVADLLRAAPSIWKLRAFRACVVESLCWQRRLGSVHARIARIGREAYGIVGVINRRFVHLPIPFRRTCCAGGFSVAFLGTHGAGKSTITEEIWRWLGWKLDVYFVYFGSGAGSSSLLRWPMKALLGLRRGALVAHRPDQKRLAPGRQPSREATSLNWARVLWALALALEKRSKLKSCLRARNRGMIVICDRYPQVQTLGYNDGPLLGAWLASTSRLRRHLAQMEYRVYERATQLAPDLVIRLDVPPKVAAGRRPTEPLRELQRRREVVRAIRYGARCRFLEVDASGPLSEVVLAVKRAIWEQLTGEHGAAAGPAGPVLAEVSPGRCSLAVGHRGLTPVSSPVGANFESLTPHNLVVEFLGVSGSGKTTLARSLATRLEQQGYRTRLLTMQRPTVSARLLGILCQSGNMCRAAFNRSNAFSDAQSLMKLLPQKSALHYARLMQYLLYLFNCQSNISEGGPQVVIFDQGFAQALYSLALFSDCGGNELAAALNKVPEPEILITLDVAPDIVARRLKMRRGLARVARVTADEGEIICNSLRIIAKIEKILKDSGCHVIHYGLEHSVSIEQSTDYLFHSLRAKVSESASMRPMTAVQHHQGRCPNVDKWA